MGWCLLPSDVDPTLGRLRLGRPDADEPHVFPGDNKKHIHVQ